MGSIEEGRQAGMTTGKDDKVFCHSRSIVIPACRESFLLPFSLVLRRMLVGNNSVIFCAAPFFIAILASFLEFIFDPKTTINHRGHRGTNRY